MGIFKYLFGDDKPKGRFEDQSPEDRKAILSAAEAKRERKRAKAVDI